jgi:hypothetical protein
LTKKEVIFFYHMRSKEGIFYGLWKAFEKELEQPFSILPLVRKSSSSEVQAQLTSRRSRVLQEVHRVAAKECLNPEDSVGGREVMSRPGLSTGTKVDGETVLWTKERKQRKKKNSSSSASTVDKSSSGAKSKSSSGDNILIRCNNTNSSHNSVVPSDESLNNKKRGAAAALKRMLATPTLQADMVTEKTNQPAQKCTRTATSRSKTKW